ncbi:zinc-finger domain-containing protein [Paracandidimonas soli]|uniref:Putative Zn-finger protein n=1 Tax=Paracandidimonas soli TaxID=1917182 RepID=A0A4R3V2R7_9BURK|nr:zinc-finger domain-containing protein [Paracandidimonas soli]TCU99085.1 putative Zn-finger protein [Paracandidimonas soli]
MSRVSNVATPKDEVITVKGADLPLYCPGPQAPLWSMHPRVYIDLSKDGSAACPYCGAKYRLEEGAKAHSH